MAVYLLREVLEQRDISPSLHVGTLEGGELLELRLLGILVQSLEETLIQDEVLITLLVVDFDIGEVRVYAEGEVGREGPWCGRPGKKGGGAVVY